MSNIWCPTSIFTIINKLHCLHLRLSLIQKYSLFCKKAFGVKISADEKFSYLRKFIHIPLIAFRNKISVANIIKASDKVYKMCKFENVYKNIQKKVYKLFALKEIYVKMFTLCVKKDLRKTVQNNYMT